VPRAVLLLWLLAASSCGAQQAVRAPAPRDPWQAAGFVAHAFGSPPGGPIYTNSREAFQASYAKGFRAFEVDLIELKDGRVVLAHDGKETHYALAKGTRFADLTFEQMRGRKFDGRWPVLFDGDLIALMQEHTDAVVLLDTKGRAETTQVAIAKRLARLAPHSVRERMVPHVHSEEQLDALRELGAFPDPILTLYKWHDRDVFEAPAVMKRYDLDTVIVRPQVYSDELRDALRAAGARWIFVHSFTTKREIEPWRKKGLGVYSNDWIGPD
jgi:glycerophosphoryl diester phosphodiesterase